MMLNLIRAPITFQGQLKPRSTTSKIIIHHSASDPMTTVEQIHQWHLAKKWAGIGYNIVIRGDGGRWEGRPIDMVGAHTYNHNGDSVGICVTGHFEDSRPTEAQMASLAETIRELRQMYGDIPYGGHRNYNATACPGKFFPWDELARRMAVPETADIVSRAHEAGLIAETSHNPSDTATKEFVLQTELNLLNKINGGK